MRVQPLVAIVPRAAEQAGDLLVAELFGPTFQGEGPSAGQQALFVRLSRCNLSCRWCDTPYTWDWSRFDPHAEARRLPVPEVARWLLQQPVRLVVITGGEPLLQQRRLLPLVVELAAAGRRIEIETNGTIPPDPELAAAVWAFNVSPKLSGSELPRPRRLVNRALEELAATGKAVFKFVVTAKAELAEIAALVDAHGLAPVWVMPEGTTSDRVLAGMRELAEAVLAQGWNLTPRLHVLLWEDARGR